MTLFHDKYRIESSRLHDWDYSSDGYYFATICTDNFKCLFGMIDQGELILNRFGGIASEIWRQLPEHFEGTTLGEFIIMPNHIHGIIRIRKPESRTAVACYGSTKSTESIKSDTAINPKTPQTVLCNGLHSKISPKNGSLSTMVRSFKSAVTNRMHQEGFSGVVWQSRFHDHIIRSPIELFFIENYIRNNPANWIADHEIANGTMHRRHEKEPWKTPLP